MSFLGLFKLTFDKTIVIFKINGREIIKIHEFVQNEKKSNLGSKMYFLKFMSFHFQKLLSHLKSALPNYSKYKVACRNKSP